MAKVQSEYDVEIKFIEILASIGYEYIELKNYEDVISNFRVKLAAYNADKLIGAKGTADFSDAELNRVLIQVDNKSVYESSKVLRDK